MEIFFYKMIMGGDEFKKLALTDIYNSILFEDVVSRFKINNIDLLQRFVRYMITSTGEIFSSKSIKNYLKSNNIYTSQDALLKYSEYLSQSFFISKCKFFEFKGKKEENMWKVLSYRSWFSPCTYRGQHIEGN